MSVVAPEGAVDLVLSGPDLLFEVARIDRRQDGSLYAWMPTGTSVTAGGRPQVAGLGVLVDDVLGYAVNDMAGGWSVSTELSVDVTGPLPSTGGITCVGRVVHADELGALATGEVSTADGRVVARCVLRGRFRDEQPRSEAKRPERQIELAPLDRTDIDTVLGYAANGAPPRLALTVTERLTNPMGNLHGGIHFCLVERAAARAAPALKSTASVRLQLVRGAPQGTNLMVTAKVSHLGRTQAVVEIQTRDELGKLYNTATVVRHASA
ncbi:hypothetical protein GCM10023350_05880 [Nocardioides endophyticus]|uniref:PaaI family thioesterase n=1 Tax=Nocardioides endophyticus TaxID=1353775 RepID=A0ABP8YE31_9ACTN